jgi:hypothetical protein
MEEVELETYRTGERGWEERDESEGEETHNGSPRYKSNDHCGGEYSVLSPASVGTGRRSSSLARVSRE